MAATQRIRDCRSQELLGARLEAKAATVFRQPDELMYEALHFGLSRSHSCATGEAV